MEFSQKLRRLLALTETQNSQLAQAILVDPSQISRMKTGARGRPKNSEQLRAMAKYFAEQCGSEYRLSALAELTGEIGLRRDPSLPRCVDAIDHWLSRDDDQAAPGPEEGALAPSLAAAMSQERETAVVKKISVGAPSVAQAAGDNSFVAYYDDRGKRQAVLDWFNLALAQDVPGDLYLFTDEEMDWVNEAPAFRRQLGGLIRQLAEKGWRVFRVEPPAQGLEATFQAIERWMPAYMLGAVRQYHYPSLRDDLHRRTLFVAPGCAAVYAHSLAGQKHSRLTRFTTDPRMVDICYQECWDILRRCRPMMRVYGVEDVDEVLDEMIRITALPADGILKTASLSVPTLPLPIMERVARENGSPLAAKLLDNLRRRAALNISLLQEHTIEEVIALADPAEVAAGRVAVSITRLIPGGIIYYTPEEYCQHLRAIIDCMKKYPSYRVILTENPAWRDVICYAKGADNVLMIKCSDPFAVFKITENQLAISLCDFLRQIAYLEGKRCTRKETLRRLERTIAALR